MLLANPKIGDKRGRDLTNERLFYIIFILLSMPMGGVEVSNEGKTMIQPTSKSVNVRNRRARQSKGKNPQTPPKVYHTGKK